MLRAVVTIVVKKRLVNSIIFFIFCRQSVVAQCWQRGSRGGDGGSTAAAASFTAEAVAWWKRNFSGSSSAFGSAGALWL